MNINVVTVEEWRELMTKLGTLENKMNELNNEVLLKKYMTLAEACALLKVSRRTMQRYRDAGLISFSQVGDKIFFLVSDIDEFISKNRIKAFAK